MKARLQKATSIHRGDFLNEMLYRMCDENPEHKKPEVTYGKLAIIGRTYAAALERTSKVGSKSQKIFATAIQALTEEDIDSKLKAAKKIELPLTLDFSDTDLGRLSQILAIHASLTSVFAKSAGMEKRSLASKYLHFHVPKVFFIYDKFATKNIRPLSPSVGRKYTFHDFDNNYAKFFMRCLILRNTIYKDHGVLLTPRQLDNLLLNKEPHCY